LTEATSNVGSDTLISPFHNTTYANLNTQFKIPNITAEGLTLLRCLSHCIEIRSSPMDQAIHHPFHETIHQGIGQQLINALED